MAHSEVPRATTGGEGPFWATVATPVGPITVTSNGQSIVRVEWRETDADTDTDTGQSATSQDAAPPDRLLVEGLRQLHAYFDNRLSTFDLPLDLGQISETARAVLTTLETTVEPGTTVTYGELAQRSGIGIPARAIGSIMGMNPLPLVIPCHRIVASDGLGGYSGGRRGEELATKRWLLEFEDALPRPLF